MTDRSSHSEVHCRHFPQPIVSLSNALKLNSTFSYSYLVKKCQQKRKFNIIAKVALIYFQKHQK